VKVSWGLCVFVVILVFNTAPPCSAQDQTLFNHPDDSRIFVGGQINLIHQQHPSFFAKYSGENSLKPQREKATSRLLTLYTGFQINKSTTRSTEVLFDVESTGGRGLSDALGLAGFTNLDVVRNPSLGTRPYIARVMFHQTFAIGRESVPADRNFLSLATEKPEKRVEIYFGKFSNADFFDTNSVGSDSHLQFMNWTVDNNGAYDYAADTRGYTWGAIVEYESRSWGVRFGETLMPRVANGIDMDWNIRRARAENVELDTHPVLFKDHPTTLRFLSYVNHANMGSYREAIDSFLAGRDPAPDIEAHRMQGRLKYGFGFNGEQSLPGDTRLFGRLGWNDGRNESFAYTEVDRHASVGGDVAGKRWHRKSDRLGIAMVFNAISGDHRRYLQLGGKGFLLGDGSLNYGLEKIVELYYTARLVRGVSVSPALQHLVNPGYNRDRGPVLVPGFRVHLDF
jgi:high affinity Mn2+ porin